MERVETLPQPLDSYEPIEVYADPGFSPFHTAFVYLYPVACLLAIWFAVDAYRRYGGLNYWHILLFFFTPLAVLVYLIAHGRALFRRGNGASLFGPGLRTRIRNAERDVRLSDTVAAHSELAELYFQDAQFDRCQDEYGKVLVAEPENQEAHYYVALCLMERGDLQAAAEHLDTVLNANPKYRFGLAALRRTECWRKLGRVDDALEERRKLHRAFPRPLFEYAYAEMLIETRRGEDARKVLQEMLDAAHSAPAEDRKWLRSGKKLLRSLGA